MPAAANSRVRIWALAARPKTLWAAVVPVVVGTAMAVEAGGFHALSALFALLGAVLIQVGTNYINDYYDFLKGADTVSRKGPVRALQSGLVSPETTRRAAALVFALAVVDGLYLVWRGGWPVLLIGLLSIAAGVLYTAGRYSLAYLGLADVFVVLFFGPVAVGGTYYVQTLGVNAVVLFAAFGPGLLSAAILLVNNVRDIDEDRRANKKTLVVRLGRKTGVALYALCAGAAALIPVVLYLVTGEHPWAMISLVILPLVVPIVRTLASSKNPVALNPMLGATSRLLLIYGLLFSIGWLI
ncbi:MAG: 1,4-dihydroxy-2-naphthoate polyprenyltransferase [Rubrobacteraceae bacterium]